MKREKLVLLCIVLLLVQLVACERGQIEDVLPEKSALRTGSDSSQDGSAARYISTVATTDVRKMEPIHFSLINGAGEIVMWRANPAASIVNMGTKAVIYFQKPGLHRVYAIDSLSLDTTFIDVDVSAEIVTEPKHYQQEFYDDDELYITPSTSPDSANILQLSIITKRSYECLNNFLLIRQEEQGNTYSFTFDKVEAGSSCEVGEKKSERITWIASDPSQNSEGNIEIHFNNKQYKGSFKRKGASYEFDWKHENGVIFTKKKI